MHLRDPHHAREEPAQDEQPGPPELQRDRRADPQDGDDPAARQRAAQVEGESDKQCQYER